MLFATKWTDDIFIRARKKKKEPWAELRESLTLLSWLGVMVCVGGHMCELNECVCVYASVCMCHVIQLSASSVTPSIKAPLHAGG